MLKKGDIVDLIAPSSGFSFDEYSSCLKIVENWGLNPRVLPYEELINSSYGFVSNDAQKRFDNLQDALRNGESKATWCMAGGYGSYHLLEMLDKVPAPMVKKIFIGFSDNSSLLNYFVNKWNWSCIYGITLLQIVRKQVSDEAVKNFQTVFFDNKYENIKLRAINETAKKQGQIAGKIIGGCLSLVQTTLGTPHSLNVTGKIILLEDDKFETNGRIDRILNHMLRADFFKGSVVVIMGSFLEEDFAKNEEGFLKTIEPLKIELDKRNIPLLRGENIGHCKNMVTVPFGEFVTIKTGDNPVLKVGL
jgi:muramoyltetrapeptide carboxypeptidase